MVFNCSKCIFIRIPKTATKSITTSFINYEEKITGEKCPFEEHNPIKYFHDNYPDLCQTYFKFTFVRNPWEKTYSHFAFLVKKFPDRWSLDQFNDWILLCAETLKKEHGRVFARNRSMFELNLTNQLDWITIEGKKCIDFIGRFENLKKDFDFICSKLKINLNLPHINVSTDGLKHYSKAYNNETKSIVQSWYQKDIDSFCYKYG